jgi:superfamily I DNA/RNA helicase
MVGDPYQCIYNDRRINFSKVGINVRGNRSRRLRVNYRTTEEIKRSAVNIVKGERYDNFDGEEESLAGYVSLMHGSIPEYYIYDNKEEELKSILSIIEDLHQKSGFEYNEIAVASYFKDSIKPIQDVLHNSNIPFSNIESKTKNKDGVVLSTLHNLKGLEFKIIIIINVNNQTYPWKPIGWEKMTLSEQKLCLRNQKSLFYMAITRAMMRVYITGTGAKADL